jgi:hypothetical protein
MAPDLDRSDRHGVGAPESHRHSLDGATGPREPGRGLSRLPTDDEFVYSVVSQDEMTDPALLSASAAIADSSLVIREAQGGRTVSASSYARYEMRFTRNVR